jgi:hypothetical protein
MARSGAVSGTKACTASRGPSFERCGRVGGFGLSAQCCRHRAVDVGHRVGGACWGSAPARRGGRGGVASSLGVALTSAQAAEQSARRCARRRRALPAPTSRGPGTLPVRACALRLTSCSASPASWLCARTRIRGCVASGRGWSARRGWHQGWDAARGLQRGVPKAALVVPRVSAAGAFGSVAGCWARIMIGDGGAYAGRVGPITEGVRCPPISGHVPRGQEIGPVDPVSSGRSAAAWPHPEEQR